MKRGRKIDAVCYHRRSNKVEGSDSFTRQAKATQAIADRMGLRILETFEDGGISGTKGLAERPALQRLMAYVETHGVKVVLIEMASRLARELICCQVLLCKFRELEIKVYDSSGMDLTDDDDPSKKLIIQIMGCLAEFEKATIVQRMASGRAKKKAKGLKVEGAKAFGEIDQREKETLARIKVLRRKPRNGRQKTYPKIVEILNREGYRNRSGGEWTAQMVRKVLVR